MNMAKTCAGSIEQNEPFFCRWELRDYLQNKMSEKSCQGRPRCNMEERTAPGRQVQPATWGARHIFPQAKAGANQCDPTNNRADAGNDHSKNLNFKATLETNGTKMDQPMLLPTGCFIYLISSYAVESMYCSTVVFTPMMFHPPAPKLSAIHHIPGSKKQTESV